MSVSVVILTLNEEINLPNCLASLSWSDDIVVVDSGSTDRTVEIAESFGCRVVVRRLDNWASHQNWINEKVKFKHPWVYYSDADEVVTPELRDELLSVANGGAEPVAYRVRYKNYFMGRWLRFSGGYPIWVLRFFRPECVRWERLVNPRPIVKGVEGRLVEHFLHYSFNKGLDAWFDKHNKYSRDEAIEALRVIDRGGLSLSGLVAADPAKRRRALKELSFRLPWRGFLRFIFQYIVRLGFLDGVPGFHWSVMNGIYEYMIDLKVMEHRRRRKGLEV